MYAFLVQIFPGVLLLIAFVGLPLALVAVQERERRLLGAAWEPVMDGELDYVVYGSYDYVRREGSMSRHDVKYEMKTTAIHFADGRACVAKARLDMHFPTGARIRILKNGLDEYRVEQA